MVRVTGLYRVAIQVPNLDAVVEFYRDVWGMHLIDVRKGIARFASRGKSYADFLVGEGARSQLDHIAFTVADKATLDALLARVAEDGVSVDQPVEKGDADSGVRWAAVLRDCDGNKVHLVVPAETGAVAEAAGAQAGPRKIGHVVLWAQQVDAMERWYRQLGLMVSDRTKAGMSFLRCNTDHHTLALIGHPTLKGLQHIAFEVETLDAVMRQLGRLKKAGVSCIWGPGRHGPGNNIFTYYQDPAGTTIEYYAELEQVAVSDEPPAVRYWGPEHSGDVWGLAGPPPPVFRGQTPS